MKHRDALYEALRTAEERNANLVAALREIARKRKLDGVAAASMQAIANEALAYPVDTTTAAPQ